VFVLASLFAALSIPRYFLFSLGLLYISWGLLKSVILGLLDRLPGGDPLLDEDEEEDEWGEVRTLDYDELSRPSHGSSETDRTRSLEDHG
jgi:hypothetical protein